MSKEITLENVGPIKKFTFAIPEQGGVVELLGWNGVGKTHALNAIQSSISHRGGVPARDGTSAAEVEGFGITARFGRRATFGGELECQVLEGKFSVGDLIDPGLQDPKAADARRIKALIQLATGEETAKPELFYELLDGGKEEFEREVSLRAMSEADVVNMAAAIKRDLEAAARRDADLAEKARLKYEATKAAVANIDLNVPDDEQQLAAAHEVAIRDFARLESEAVAIAEANQRASLARQSLREFQAAEKLLSVAAVQETVKVAADTLSSLTEELIEAEQRIRELKSQIESQEKALKDARLLLKAATDQQQLIASWEKDIAASTNNPISEEELQEARLKVDEARNAMNLGAVARRAKDEVWKADDNKRISKELTLKSERLRSAAQGTDTVLSKIVQQLNCPLRVSRGRLVTDTDRGEEVFDDLSDGERVRMAMEIAINAVKQPNRDGLLPIEQRFWQDLNPANRQLICDMVQGTGVVVITARATDDPELRAEILDGAPALLP